ncbi:hypothetical protein [Pseudanabaena sp. FACHB-2040]|uniref:hypothetical protein n=1 Tax=Pseudanabaena sp. FACHB-2040 TaxID=2692859 RepID=UPI0016820D66|nr:hypothetical protein [Pseudanabaena sp. FACHB-2040]MBD2258218.1 hypothetical protein [Pseudanabaena sp. FACHB-2040]
MNLLKEAMSLAEDTAGYTLSSFQKLVELRDRAKGDEAALISRLVETFIAQAPANIVQQIMKMI